MAETQHRISYDRVTERKKVQKELIRVDVYIMS